MPLSVLPVVSDSDLFLSCQMPLLIGTSDSPQDRATLTCISIQRIFMMRSPCASGFVLGAEGAAGNKTDPNPHPHNT